VRRNALLVIALALPLPRIAAAFDDDEWDDPKAAREHGARAFTATATDGESAHRLALPPGPRGTLGVTALQGAIRPHLAEVRFCFDRERAQNPDVSGKVYVRFVVSPEGRVLDAELASSTADSPALERCLVAAVRRWEFPRPSGGGAALVTYPFSGFAG
jgi:TonB family protein